MKIILSAFNGQLTSKPMDIPEGNGIQFDMVLMRPITTLAFTPTSQFEKMPTRCTFKMNGKKKKDAYIYELTDIHG